MLDNTAAEVIVNHVMEAVPSGSYLVVSHATTELGGEANAEAMRFWNEHAKPPITARTGAEIARFFEGLELVEPGLVPGAQWRPDQAGRGQAAPIVPLYAGVAANPDPGSARAGSPAGESPAGSPAREKPGLKVIVGPTAEQP